MSELLSKVKYYAKNRPDQKVFCVEEYTNSESFECKSITWSELEQWSDYLAVRLDKECKSKTPVVVYGHKNPYMLVCFLACVKSGRAYCPIDISVPDERVHTIIEEISPDIIFCVEPFIEEKFRTVNQKEIHEWIESANDIQEEIRSLTSVTEEDVFYIIFTSGSTGKPKGVQITSNCLDNFLKWIITVNSNLKDDGSCIFINQAPFSFDLSVMDIYTSLYLGGTIWALSKTTQGNIKNLNASFSHSNAKIWVSTASFVEMCLSDKNFNENLMPNLSVFLFCGETLTNHTAERIYQQFPRTEIVNTYGPTESTVAVTNIAINDSVLQTYNPLPIGASKPGTWLTVEDKLGNILSDNEKGELVITGDSVSIGYLNNTELTEKMFEKRTINGKEYRAYHTGDKGYRQGELFFYCGRLDYQIKLHGYRIEIEDIEANIMKLDNISQVAVLPNYKHEQIKSLSAFVVMKKVEENISEFDRSQDLRVKLKELLPDYMIPKKIIFMDALPMTSNGKVDRKALQEKKK